MLRWADFAGNNMFNSVGNLQSNPKAGLLFVDWVTGVQHLRALRRIALAADTAVPDPAGDTLQLTGTGVVNFQDRSLPGAQRTISFTVQKFLHVSGQLPQLVCGPVCVPWAVRCCRVSAVPAAAVKTSCASPLPPAGTERTALLPTGPRGLLPLQPGAHSRSGGPSVRATQR